MRHYATKSIKEVAMKAVLISIQPKWCELIASGKKMVEVRKTRPKLETPFKVYIYCTKQGKQFFHGGIGEKECLFKNPDTEKIKFDYSFELMCCKNEYTKDNFLSGKVIGEFVCDSIGQTGWFRTPNDILWKDFFIEEICLTNRELYEYSKGDMFYEWNISNLVIYDKPRELNEFYTICPEFDKDEPLCEGCEYEHTEYSGEDCPPYFECKCEGRKPIKRPPQSWCYVDEPIHKGNRNYYKCDLWREVMSKAKVNTLLERIDEALVELEKITGANHISAFIVNGCVSIDDLTDLGNPQFEYFRKGGNNNGKTSESTTVSI